VSARPISDRSGQVTARLTSRGLPLRPELVLATLAGVKRETRRVCPESWLRCLDPEDEEDRATAIERCPYGRVGDHLWVREQLVPYSKYEWTIYAADREYVKPDTRWPWKVRTLPSRFCPRWASRVTLRITSVDVERLQAITDAGALREGVTVPEPWWSVMTRDGRMHPRETTRDVFARLWDSLNAARGYSWVSSPWVWVIGFEMVDAKGGGA